MRSIFIVYTIIMSFKKFLIAGAAYSVLFQSSFGVLAMDMSANTNQSIEDTIMQQFTEGFMEWYNNPESLLEKLDEDVKLSPREQFHVDRIVAQMDAIIQKAGTDEQKLQKSLDVSAYLLDTLVGKFKNTVTLMMQAQNDPSKEIQLKREMIRTPFLPNVKVILGAVQEISIKYTGPYLEQYVDPIMELNDVDAEEVTQEQVSLVVHKVTTLLSMIDTAFANNAPNINSIMQEYVGISSSQFFYSARVAGIMGLDELFKMAQADLDPTDEYDAQELAQATKLYGYVKQGFATADASTQKAYNEAMSLRTLGKTTLQYREMQKPALKPAFIELVDKLTEEVSEIGY